MNRNRAGRKSFMAALTLCLVSAIAMTAGLMYNKTGKNKELADSNETTAEFATAEEAREIVENSTLRKNEKEKNDFIEMDTYEQDTEEIVRATEADTEQDTEAEIQPETEPQIQEADVVNAPAESLYFDEASTLGWPLNGEVVLEYSMDKTIYFPTLDLYKCNSGMMIQGDEGAGIFAAATGVVTDIHYNHEFGTMVSIDIGNGYETVYGQLNEVHCEKGETVEKGQQIGTLSKPTAYYESEGYHLYFKVTKDGVPVNPLDYLNE